MSYRKNSIVIENCFRTGYERYFSLQITLTCTCNIHTVERLIYPASVYLVPALSGRFLETKNNPTADVKTPFTRLCWCPTEQLHDRVSDLASSQVVPLYHRAYFCAFTLFKVK